MAGQGFSAESGLLRNAEGRVEQAHVEIRKEIDRLEAEIEPMLFGTEGQFGDAFRKVFVELKDQVVGPKGVAENLQTLGVKLGSTGAEYDAQQVEMQQDMNAIYSKLTS